MTRAPKSSDIQTLAEVGKALAHPLRLKILYLLLEDSRIVSDLQDLLAVDASVVSKHLAILKDAGMVTCAPEWRCRRYSLRHTDDVQGLLKALEAVDSAPESEAETQSQEPA